MTLAILLWFVQDLGALSAEGASAMRSQRYADAVRVYRTLLEKDAANPMWRFNLGLAHFYSGAKRPSIKAPAREGPRRTRRVR